MLQKFENIVYYKCECDDNIHIMTSGQKLEPKAFDTKKEKCLICGAVKKIQKKERLTITNNKVTKEII